MYEFRVELEFIVSYSAFPRAFALLYNCYSVLIHTAPCPKFIPIHLPFQIPKKEKKTSEFSPIAEFGTRVCSPVE